MLYTVMMLLLYYHLSILIFFFFKKSITNYNTCSKWNFEKRQECWRHFVPWDPKASKPVEFSKTQHNFGQTFAQFHKVSDGVTAEKELGKMCSQKSFEWSFTVRGIPKGCEGIEFQCHRGTQYGKKKLGPKNNGILLHIAYNIII